MKHSLLAVVFASTVLIGCSKSADPATAPSSPNVGLQLLLFSVYPDGTPNGGEVHDISKFTPDVGNSVGGIGAGSLRVDPTGGQFFVTGHKFRVELPQNPGTAPNDAVYFSIAEGDTMATVYSADRTNVVSVFIATRNAQVAVSPRTNLTSQVEDARRVLVRSNSLRVIIIP